MPPKIELSIFRFVYFLVGLSAVLFAYSLYKRPVHVDAAILGEPTYWLAHDGVLRSELQRGWQHAEDHFFFTHKLFLYIGAGWVTLFGWSSTVLNSLSLIYFAALLGAWALIAKSVQLSWKWFAVFGLLLLTTHHIYELSFVYRPEIAVAAFSAWCFYFLNRFLAGRQPIFVIIAGLLAACGVGHHLNGVVIVVAGFFLLFSQRQFLAAIAFGAIGTLGLGFYLLDIRSLQDFQLMISQFQHMQDIQAIHTSWVHYALNIPAEQKRFLHSPVEIGMSLLILPLFFFNWRELWRKYRNFVLYAGISILTLALISHDKDTKYLSLHIPILLFLATLSLRRALADETPRYQIFRKQIIPLLFVLFFIGEWRSNAPITFNKDERIEAYGEIASDLPEGTNVLGPVFAVFWAIPHNDRLQSFITYQVLASHKDFVMDAAHLAQALEQFQIKAILVDPEATTKFKLQSDSLPQFSLIRENKNLGLSLYRRKD